MKKSCLLGAFLVSILTAPAVCAQSFDLHFFPGATSGEKAARAFLQAEAGLEEVSAALARIFRLPRRVALQFGGELGPLYDPATSTINIPYRFVSKLIDAFPDTADAVDATHFVVYHEIGHALIDHIDLQGIEDSEEAADALAVLISIELVGTGGGPVLAASRLILTPGLSLSLHPTADSGIDPERSRQLICWIIGSDPGRLEWLAEDAGIPVPEADSCPMEYEEVREEWLLRLRPFLIR